jgi:uncharacterized protein YjbI with pentapeptide repeats
MNTYFNDLVNLTADNWNIKVANTFGYSVLELESLTNSTELRHIGERIKLNVDKNLIFSDQLDTDINAELDQLVDIKANSIIYKPTKLDKYRIRVNDNKLLVESIALSGKIIVGCDFTGSDLSNSYFCGCVFYNCIFTDCNLTYSVINSCVFNSCTLNKCDFTSSAIARTRFYESNLEHSTNDYVNISDCVYVACSMSNTSLIQSKVLYTSFIDSVLSKIDFKDSDLIQCVFTNIDIRNSDFKRSSMVDCILIRCNLHLCDFNSFSITCTTNSMCVIDQSHKSIFEMNHALYSPSVVEWENEDE